MFSIINDRGLQLRRIDILKANNIDPEIIKDYKTRLYYADLWEGMENEIGSDEFEKLFFILRTIEIKEKAKEDIFKEFEKLVFKRGKVQKGKEFIEYVKDYHKIYKELILDKIIDIDNKEKKNSLINLLNLMTDYLRGNDWVAPVLLYFKKFNSENILKF